MIEPGPAERSLTAPHQVLQQLGDLLHGLAEAQAQIAETQTQMRGMLERIITAIEAQATPQGAPPAPTPTIATYDAMYGPIPSPTPWVPPPVPPRRRHWLVRWLVQEA